MSHQDNEKAAYTDKPPSYHGLHITTKDLKRTSIFNLHYGYRVMCCRVGGWCLSTYDGVREIVVAGEYDTLSPLRLDVNGVVIVDGFTDSDAQPA